ncbi:MAG TPA: ATP-binding protein [Candidatus Scybalocola faecipullorum]|nr:ATP-binding protein [Candidatus Scybalocola faecipullorum]
MEKAMQWLPNFRLESPGFGLDALCGVRPWKRMFKGCLPAGELDGALGLSSAYFFLICGPAGIGKQTICTALAGDLCERGYMFVHIPGIALAGESDNEACANIRSFFDEIEAGIGQNAAGYYIWIDSMESLCGFKRAGWLLAQQMQRLEDSDIPCVIAATIKDGREAPAEVKKMMTICQLEVPESVDRRTYLENYFESMAVDENLSVAQMTQMTEGFSYAQLAKTVTATKMLLKEKEMAQAIDPSDYASDIEMGRVEVDADMFGEAVRVAGTTFPEISAAASSPPSADISAIMAALAGSGLGGAAMGGAARGGHTKKEDPKGFVSSFRSMNVDD